MVALVLRPQAGILGIGAIRDKDIGDEYDVELFASAARIGFIANLVGLPEKNVLRKVLEQLT